MLGKSVVITGGTGELGTAVVVAAIGRNARVTLTYIDDDERAALEDALSESERASATFVKANLRDEAQVRALIGDLKRVDVLLHLVGSHKEGPTPQFPLADFHEQIETNLATTFLMCRAVLPLMLEANYGRIVTIASRQAISPTSGFAVYSAAKAGVLAFTKALAHEARGHDVTANIVIPGPLATDENRQRYDPRRLIEPSAVAEIVAFLGGGVAGHLRGTAIEMFGNNGDD